MTQQREGEISVTLPNGTVRFPRFRLERGGVMTQEQVDAEAAAFAEADRLMGYRAPGTRAPGDDDDGPLADRRTPEQRDQDVDFEARAVRAMARREMERRGLT